ncbi:xenobiotic compound monooxygenase DszA family [Penicillium argentinense]|uniref:Xenobiotic compound monooxygenase DszA family n=1 Tax=Penicillium argentinense TaxID=1131581 RepID=A0A9W9FLQ5_9EURO|nr:xenobiotic compound monooxygenase DszA family [Penicillium argentinense]KAJ5102551.1 xenobiotic compound monooxygenase DszA family [Penicillium argentinense]
MFIADTLGRYNVYKGPAIVVPSLSSGAQFPVNDLLYLIPALAAVTKNLIFGVTASVTAARNHGLTEQIPQDERYAIAHEYLEVLYKLWEGSFRDGAVLADQENTSMFPVRTSVSLLHSALPFCFRQVSPRRGTRLEGSMARPSSAGDQAPEATRGTVDNIRNIAKREGRDPSNIKVIVGINVLVAATDEDAKAKREGYIHFADDEGALALFGGWLGVDCPRNSTTSTENLPWTKQRIVEYISVGGLQAKLIGSPTTVAEELEPWVDISGVDGFNLAHSTNPGTFEDIIEFLLPELRRRGLFRAKVEKEGATAREMCIVSRRLPDDYPGSQFKRRAGEEVPQYQRNE